MCYVYTYAIRHKPLCSIQKYFLLPWLLWVLESISAWPIMSITSVFGVETRKYCRVLFTNIHLEVIQFLLSVEIQVIETEITDMLLSCQLSQEQLLIPGIKTHKQHSQRLMPPFWVQSYCPGIRNCFFGLLFEGNHKWIHQVGFSICVHFLSECHRKRCANAFQCGFW